VGKGEVSVGKKKLCSLEEGAKKKRGWIKRGKYRRNNLEKEII